MGNEGGRDLRGSDRWLVALPLGLLFGWGTVANFAGVATMLVGVGLLDGTSGRRCWAPRCFSSVGSVLRR